MTLLIAMLPWAGTNLASAQTPPNEPVEGYSNQAMLDDCFRQQFHTMFGGSAKDPVTGLIILLVHPEVNNYKNTYANLRDKGAWVGIIENVSDEDQPKNTTPPMVLKRKRACVWIGRNPAKPDSLRAYIYQEGGSRQGPRKVYHIPLGLDPHGDPISHLNPDAHFSVQPTLFGQYETVEQIINSVREAVVFKDSGTWYTCESNGCCRVY